VAVRLDTGEPDEGLFNLTPLIDMVFLLLVFFLASTTFLKEEVELDLTLPEATTGQPAKESHLMVIHIGKDGAVTVDGRAVTAEGLRQKLVAAAARHKDQEVLIKGDTRVEFGTVAKVFDACLAAKLTAVSIGAQPVAEPGPLEALPEAGGR
jgi:biopolymer transport protein ExbD